MEYDKKLQKVKEELFGEDTIFCTIALDDLTNAIVGAHHLKHRDVSQPCMGSVKILYPAYLKTNPQDGNTQIYDVKTLGKWTEFNPDKVFSFGNMDSSVKTAYVHWLFENKM